MKEINTNVFRNLSYGVYVTTSLDEDKPVGCITNSVMQISSNPATIAVSVNHENYTNHCIKKSKKFAISILSEKTEPNMIGIFGFQSSKNINKFADTSYELNQSLPIINDNCGYIICELIDTMETETHSVFLGKVISSANYQSESPMTYRYYHEVLKGSSPKNAPTYVEENKNEVMSETKKWKCKICGYVYEGTSIPENYICPICGQPHTAFIEIEN